MQMLTIALAQHGPAARRQYAGLQGQITQGLLFDVTEALFPFTLEELADRTADALLDHLIGIRERQLQTSGQLAPDSGLARSGQADETDRQETVLTPLFSAGKCDPSKPWV